MEKGTLSVSILPRTGDIFASQLGTGTVHVVMKDGKGVTNEPSLERPVSVGIILTREEARYLRRLLNDMDLDLGDEQEREDNPS